MESRKEFDKLWTQATTEPALKTYVSKNKVVVDLSLDNVLDLYVAHASKGVRENKISQSVFNKLKSDMDGFKSSVNSLDEGKKLKELNKSIGASIKKLW